MSDHARRLDRRLPWVIFGLLLASYAYFYQGGGWNENSRMDLVRAMVDDHSLAIDAYHLNTGDKAKIGDHYYSDKAPGLSVAAIPTYLLVRPLHARLGEHTFIVIASYAATVLTVGVATALLGLLLYGASRRLGASPRASVVAALAYGLGTTAFPFATQFFGHQLAALLVFSAFWLLWDCRERHSDLRSLAAGSLCAAAVCTEFPTAAVAVILFAYHAEGRLRWRRLATFSAGFVTVLAPLAIYLARAFGSPFKTGYAILADAGARGEMLEQGLFGVTYPHLSVWVELLIGRYRGLLPYSPVLLLALAGFALGLGGLPADELDDDHVVRPARRELCAALAVIVYYLLFVSSYAWWHGGASFGSRHLLPMLPFLVLPLGWVADLRPRLTFALLVASIAVMSMVTSVQPKPSERVRDPFFGGIAPAFFRGDIAAGKACPLVGNPDASHAPFLKHGSYDAFNLGMVLGGRHRLLSLLPLLALWLSTGFELWRATRRPRLNEIREAPAPEQR